MPALQTRAVSGPDHIRHRSYRSALFEHFPGECQKYEQLAILACWSSTLVEGHGLDPWYAELTSLGPAAV